MASSLAADEPLLATSIRVLRNKTPLQELIEIFPFLEQKSLTSPSSLTPSERRLLLDLPDEEDETANISAITNLSRAELIEKATNSPASLTQEELLLLGNRFWSRSSTWDESGQVLHGLVKTTKEASERIYAARKTAYLPGEDEAILGAMRESARRDFATRDNKLRIAAEAALPGAPDWIRHLYEAGNAHWGFICLYDAAAQKLGAQRLDNFDASLGGLFSGMMGSHPSKDIIDKKWKLLKFNAPNTAFAPIDSEEASSFSIEDGAVFREAFQAILKDPQDYQKAEDVVPVTTPTHQFRTGISASGVLTNTFLVIDTACIDSVVPPGNATTFWDRTHILALEADFPVKGRKYIEGYKGYTRVRLDQLMYYFYELRLEKSEDVGMDEIWKAAQSRPNKAFVSMDPEEGLNWTSSRGMVGFTPDSILGKRWYALKEAKG